MNKSELLDIADKDKECIARAKTLARQSLSDDTIEPIFAAAKKLKTQLNKAGVVGVLLLWLGVTVGLSRAALSEVAPFSNLSAAAVAVGASAFCAAVASLVLVLSLCMVSDMLGHGKTVSMLTPVAKTSYCEFALSLVKDGGPLVAAWRAVALEERGQLYLFDVEIMGALARWHKAEAYFTEYQTRQEKACRELHGITT